MEQPVYLPMTSDEIVEARRDLCRVGLVEYAGKFRDDQPVWRATELLRRAQAAADEGDLQARQFLLFATADYGDVESACTLGRALAQRLGCKWTGFTR